MGYNLYLALIIVSFLSSLTGYFQKSAQPYLRMFPVFLFLTIVIELFAIWLASRGTTSTSLYNFFSVVEFLFYMYVIREIIHSKKVKRLIFHTAWIYALLGVANILFIQKIVSFNSITYALGCLLISILCVYFFFELFQMTGSVNLTQLPAFWICTGLLFYYTCSFPLWGLANFLRKLPIVRNIQFILLLLNVFLYSSFTIAFLCRIRVKNSTS
jgi:hypothetical protein